MILVLNMPLQSMKLLLLLLLLLLPSPYALYFTFKSLPHHFRSNINMAYFWILVTFLMVFLLAIKGSKRSAAKKLPPGPWKLPFVGNLHQIAAAGSLPHHSLRNMAKKYGPLMHLQLGEVSSIIVTSPEIAKEIFITNGVIFAQRPHIIAPSIMTYNSRDIALAPYGSYWRQLRKICTLELLTAKRVQSFQSIRNDEVSVLVNDLASNEGSLINLTEKIFSLTYAITSRAAFGAKSKQQDAYISIVKEVSEMSAGFSIADIYPSIKMLPVITGMKQKAEKLLRRSDRTFQAILDEHREGKHQGQAGEDLITCLLKLQEYGDLEFPLTDNDIKAVIWDIFSGGGETSSTIVDWAMTMLLKNPTVMEKAQEEVRQHFDKMDETSIQEMRYLQAIIKETLRLHPSFPLLLPRESRENCEINGYKIPAKTKVIVNAWAIGRDPNYWSDPERFYPERFLDKSIDYKGTYMEFIPFGAGRRICPGILFALPNIELPLANLLYHFDWKLPNGMRHEDLHMDESFGITARRKDDLLLIPVLYQPRLS